MSLCVRVTSALEVGYGGVTEGITDGKSVKNETTGRQTELEANHRWVKCNYPYFFKLLFIIKHQWMTLS